MKRPSDERWYELDDVRALGEPLSADELAFLDEHADALEGEPAQELFAEIGSYGAYEPVRDEDCQRAEATLSQFNSGRTARGNLVTLRTASVAVLAIAAAVLLWIALPRGSIGYESVADVRVSTGSFVLAGDELVTGTTVPSGEWIHAVERACLDIGRGRACVEQASELRIVDGAIELRTGTLAVEDGSVELRDENGTRVLEAGETIAATPTEVVAVAPRAAATPPEPAPPVVEIDAPEPTTAAAAPTRQHARAQPERTASQMLADARALANAGSLGRAVAAYDALRRAHPHSADAHAANVSIGLLQLRRGKSREALRSFDRYLDRAGGLAEEARWGRVKALHAMRRTGARDRAIDQLLAAHPRTVYAAEAKAMRAP